LTLLRLANNQLSGVLPEALSTLKQLLTLNLQQNQLSGTILASFAKLFDLEVLDLAYNDFTGTIPPALSEMASLQQLRLTSNQLSGTIPASLGSLSALLILDVAQNLLTGTLPAALGIGESALEALFFEFNSISGTLPTQFGNLQYLETIDAVTNEGQFPLMGGCWPAGFTPPGCRLSQESMFSCSCDAPNWCGQCACYNETGQQICDQGLDKCRRGCTCTPTDYWYTCSDCPADVDPIPPEYVCARNSECQTYGCSSTSIPDPVAACIEGGPNERLCECPEGFQPAENGTDVLVADEVFVGCVEKGPRFSAGQIVGIVLGSVAGALLWTGLWYFLGSTVMGGSGVNADYVTL